MSLGRSETLRFATSARRAALVAVGLRRTKGHCQVLRPLSFSARPWCDVLAAASIANQHRVSRAAQARRRSVSLGRRRNTQVCCVRAPCRAGCGRPTAYERALPSLEASLLRCAPVVRRASCRLERQPIPRVLRGAGAPALGVSGQEAQHQVCCMRAPCRAGGGRPTAYERALPRLEASLLRRAPVLRLAIRRLQRQPAPNVSRGAGAPAQARRRSLSLGKRRNTQACCVRAPCRADCGRYMAYERPLLRREASLFLRAPVVRRAS